MSNLITGFIDTPYNDVNEIFTSTQITSDIIGETVFTKDGSAYKIVAANTGDFNHPISGMGMEVITATNPYSWGIKADGITNDSTNVGRWQSKDKERTISVSGALSVGSNYDIKGFTIKTNSSGDQIQFQSGATDIILEDIKSSWTTGSVGLQINNPNVKDVRIDSSSFIGTMWPFLVNQNANNSKNFWFTNNYIYSPVGGDAIEINVPSIESSNYIISGNILGNDPNGSATTPNSGFSFGLANADYWVFSSSVIEGSRLEGIHIEDGQKGGVISAISAYDLKGDGIRIYGPSASQGRADPPMISGVSMTATEDNSANAVHIPYNGGAIAYPALKGVYLDSIYARGFNTGIAASERTLTKFGGTLSGVKNVASVGQWGDLNLDVLVTDSPSLERLGKVSQGARIYGDVHMMSDLPIILDNSGNSIPSSFEGTLSVNKTTVANEAAAYIKTRFFYLPDYLEGEFSIECGDNNDYFKSDWKVKWDGTTLTTDKLYEKVIGAVSGGSFSVDKRRITFTFYRATAKSARNIRLVFRGKVNQGSSAPNLIKLVSGHGFAGSVLESSPAGQWYVNNVAIQGQTGKNFTILSEYEGKPIRCGTSDEFRIWTPSDINATTVRWWKVNEGMTFNNGKLTNWVASNGSILEQPEETYAPTVVVDAVSGHPRLRTTSNPQLYMTSPETFVGNNHTILATAMSTGYVWVDWENMFAVMIDQATPSRRFVAVRGAVMADTVRVETIKTRHIGTSASPVVWQNRNLVTVFQHTPAAETVRVDGVQVGHKVTPPTLTDSSFMLFQSPDMNRPYDNNFLGWVYDLVVVSGAMSNEDIQRYEGYAAWKFGKVAELASGHPYKTSPPIIT